MTFTELAHKVLKESKSKLTAAEIWEWAKTKGYETEVGSQGKTPWLTISARIYVDMRDNKDTVFAITETRPKKFYLKEFAPNDIISTIAAPHKKKEHKDYDERELHPYLVYYANTYLKAYTKTIYHERSKKKGYAEWLHPDIVGCRFLFQNWNEKVTNFSQKLGNNVAELFSFEMKKEVTLNNYRESFFQAVSNSSWANKGYLVTAEMEEDEDLYRELERLSASFGIGVIKLNVDDPDSSEMLFLPEEKDNLDLDTIDKLAKVNPDFLKFIQRVSSDVSGGEIRKEEYDEVSTKEKLIKNKTRF